MSTALPTPYTEQLRQADERTLRQDIAANRQDLEYLKRETATIRMQQAAAIVDAAGGVKALGPNEAAQQTAIELCLLQSGDYQDALRRERDQLFRLRLAEAELDARQEMRKLRQLDIQERLLRLAESGLGELALTVKTPGA